MNHETVLVATEQLKPNPANPYSDHPDPALDKDIKEHGIRKALIIKDDYTIMDGERRWRRAVEFGIAEVPCEIRGFDGVSDELAIVRLNLYRRKTPREIYKETKILEKHLRPKARQQQGQRTDLSSNLTKSKPMDVRDQVADRVGMSSGQVTKVKTIYEHEDEYPQVAKKVDSGELSVHAGYEEIKQLKRIGQDLGEAIDKEILAIKRFCERFTNTVSGHVARLNSLSAEIDTIETKDLPTLFDYMNENHDCTECNMSNVCQKLLSLYEELPKLAQLHKEELLQFHSKLPSLVPICIRERFHKSA